MNNKLSRHTKLTISNSGPCEKCKNIDTFLDYDIYFCDIVVGDMFMAINRSYPGKSFMIAADRCLINDFLSELLLVDNLEIFENNET